MKRNRIIATVLSFVMILGLFTAFPAMTATKASAATTNYALGATYRFDSTVATNGTGDFGDGTTYTEYHSGKLNDGTIATGSSTGTNTSIECGYGTSIVTLTSGTVTVYYKLNEISTISTVNVFAGRRDNPYRGFFENVKVYVGHSETDTETVNLLGSAVEANYTPHADSAYVRNYSVTGVPKTGNYVIIQMYVSGLSESTSEGKGVLNLSEIQLWGVSPTLANLSRTADYKYSSNTGTNGTGDFGDGERTASYGDGKLNNGYIATAATSSTTDTVELSVGDMSALTFGTFYVYYKLSQASTVEFVNIMAGRRDVTYRGYFDSASVYVGNSETDISSSTLLGKITEDDYTSYENSTYVRRYTVTGATPKTGTYVIIEFNIEYTNSSTTEGKGVVALSEVQVWGTANSGAVVQNIASAAAYRTPNANNHISNAEGTWGEKNCNIYHSGRLNDGVIAPSYTQETSSTTERQTTEFFVDESFSAGTVYVYYKLAAETMITQVNAYTNKQVDNSSRDYPASVNIYVGNSETDISDSTKLGTVSYTQYNEGVRNYTATGAKLGTYVIVALTTNTSTGITVALTEVEIFNGPTEEYEVTFVDKDGNVLKTETVYEGASATAPTAPEVEGYDFAGWDTSFTNVTSDITVKATYTIKNFTVTFLGDGGTTLKTETVQYGGSATAPEAPEVEGKTFTGWDVAYDSVKSNLTINAIYATETFTVTFIGNDGEVLKEQIVGYGQAATAPEAPSIEGLYFKGWDKAFDNITEDTTVTIVYSDEPDYVLDRDFKVTVNANYGKYDTDGDGVEDFTGIAVDLSVGNITYDRGLLGIEGFLNFDNSVLTPLYVTDEDLNGTALDNPPKTILNWPTFTLIGQNLYAIEGLCQAYSMADGSTVDPNNPNTKFSKDDSRMRFRYILHTDYYEGYNNGTSLGVTGDGEMALRYYFIVPEGCEGQTFTFSVPDTPDATHISECALYAPMSYLKTSDTGTTTIAYSSVYGKGGFAKVTIPEPPKEFTVTFVGKDGETLKTETVLEGSAATAPEAPAVEGYTFIGWDVAFDNIAADTTVTAQYEINKYTVTFVANGETVKEETVEHGTSATAPEAPAVEGYTFKGWDVAFDNVTADITVTAQYEINKYTVTFVANGETVKEETVEYGASATAPEAPAVEGYTFIGWDVAFDNVTADITVTAQYEINKYTVTFVANGETVKEETVEHGASATAPEAPAVEGYTFKGWDVAFDNVTADITVTAQYEINKYTVTFVGNDGATLKTETVEYGSAATAPEAPAVEGYTFKGWDVAFDNVTADITVTAQYEINKYTVKFVGKDGETVKEETVEHGASAIAPEAPAVEGYDFTGWNKSFDNVTEDITVTAIYTIKSFTVTFLSEDGEILKEQTVTYGASATAPTAPAIEGYTFKGWDKAFDNITADTTATAVYAIKTFTVMFIADGKVVKEETVEYGASATAPEAPTVEGYDFTGWNKSFDNVTEDITVTAIYTIKSFTVTFLSEDGEILKEQTVEYGKSAAAPKNVPTVAGKTFKGWDVDFSNVTGDITVTAQYEINKYTVTFVANGETVKEETVEYGASATAPEAPVVEGFEFKGWDVAFDNITADTTVTAVYEEVVAYDFFTFVEGADNTYVTIDEANGYLKFAAGPMTVAAIKALFVDTDITFAKSTGAAQTSGNVATGATITSTINGQTKTLTIVVYGDVDGNGRINANDYSSVESYVSGIDRTLTGAYFAAANVDGNTRLNANDYGAIEAFASGINSNF